MKKGALGLFFCLRDSCVLGLHLARKMPMERGIGEEKTMPPRVLLVDDEPHITQALKRGLRKKPYEVLTAHSGDEALQLLSQETVDVIVSDEHMPHMPGSELFARIHQDHPETIRILLTGQASVEAAMRAVNEGQIFRFLMKPCREIELARTIETALHSREQETTPLVALMLENVSLVQELEQANQLKHQFLSTLSHELRTPLNVIIGYNELMLDGVFGLLSAEQADIVQRVTGNSMLLRDLIEMMLDVGRIEAGQLPITLTQVHIHELMEEVQVEIADLLECRQKPDIHLEWEIGPSVSTLQTDREKLKLVLNSLISNAFKFTDQGSVGVCTTACDNGVSFCIRDTGIGIAPNILPRIFEPFRQGDESTTRRHGGMGLGLYLVKCLLELLGGTITVTSQVEHGSTFRIWMPIQGAEEMLL